MAILIEPYREEHRVAMQDFNRRLQEGGAGSNMVFYRSPQPHWLPHVENRPLYNEYFVALDGATIRGAYALKHETVFVRGCGTQAVACYHHPLSEGIVDRSYAAVGGLMLRDALRRQPRLYALGMGGLDRPLARMLAAVGWNLFLVPFYFKAIRPYRFLRNIQALRQTFWRRVLIDFSAITGLGPGAFKIAQEAARLGVARPAPFIAEQMDEFDGRVDRVWSRAQKECAIAALRNSATLRLLYPASEKDLTRIRLQRDQEVIGWAVVGARRKDPKFGDLRVGSIIDCLALPGEEQAVIEAASGILEAQGMDLIVANHGHRAWRPAFRSAGYCKAPSNFVLALSKELSQLLEPLEQNQPLFHITRADGDGLPRNF